MPTAMRALKTFTGRPGEGYRAEHLVEAGDDIKVEAQVRVEYLERTGLAMRTAPAAKMQKAPTNKMEPSPKNKAAAAGPLGSTGGESGTENPAPSSSPPARAPRRRTSRKPEGWLDL